MRECRGPWVRRFYGWWLWVPRGPQTRSWAGAQSGKVALLPERGIHSQTKEWTVWFPCRLILSTVLRKIPQVRRSCLWSTWQCRWERPQLRNGRLSCCWGSLVCYLPSPPQWCYFKVELRGLTANPVFASHSDLVGQFVDFSGADCAESFGYLSVGEFSEIDESVLAELQSFSAGGCALGRFGDFREAST